MTDAPLSIRIPDDLLMRLDRIASAMSKRAAGAEVTRSAALRVALARGLEVLEARLVGGKRKRGN
jgi:predicted transcriptional regulator